VFERWLGTALDPSYRARVHVCGEHSDANYEVGYGAVELPPGAVVALQEGAGLRTLDRDLELLSDPAQGPTFVDDTSSQPQTTGC
jgi:hypothetical protein